MRDYPINPKLKRLIATLYRLKIEKYLITDHFENICLENGVDDFWKHSEEVVRSRSTVAVLIPGYTGDAKEALPIFIEILLSERKNDFLEVFNDILEGFFKWKNEKLDLSELKERLVELGFDKEKVSSMGIFNMVWEDEEEYSQVPNFKRELPVENLCFVLMPFDEKFDSIYNDIIVTAVKTSKLECKRADNIYSTRPVMDDIIEHIKKARIIIADLTTKNPNVFYEIGLCHAWGKNVILLSQKEEEVPFDLRHYRRVIYEDSVGGGKLLKEGIVNTLNSVLGRKREEP